MFIVQQPSNQSLPMDLTYHPLPNCDRISELRSSSPPLNYFLRPNFEPPLVLSARQHSDRTFCYISLSFESAKSLVKCHWPEKILIEISFIQLPCWYYAEPWPCGIEISFIWKKSNMAVVIWAHKITFYFLRRYPSVQFHRLFKACIGLDWIYYRVRCSHRTKN